MTCALLLSGGMDSTALAYWLRPKLAITIDYGQLPAAAEIQAAKHVCDELVIRHEVVRVDASAVGSGDLSGRAALTVAADSEWWPYRNQLLITLAAMRAITLGTRELLLASVSSDANFRDGTSEFVMRLDQLMQFQEGGLRVHAPAIQLTTEDLVRTAAIPLSMLAWSHSCHRSNLACGDCRGCAKHRRTMKALGYAPY